MIKTITILNTPVKMESETIFLTAKQISELFETSLSNISEHISNIYKDKELLQDNTFREYRNVSNQPIKHYNLDMLIALGYRIKSNKATKFRIEATKVLKEYLTKGEVKKNNEIKVPTNMKEALQIAMQLVEEKEKLEIELKEVKQENKVLDVLHKVDDNATYNLQTCGKLLHLQPNKFIAKLKELGYLHKNNFPYQKYINSEYFVVKVVTTTSRDLDGSEVIKKREQAFITTKGYKYFEKLLSTEFQDVAITDLKEAIQN
jgi:phage antirepressor YoqD-like protein